MSNAAERSRCDCPCASGGGDPNHECDWPECGCPCPTGEHAAASDRLWVNEERTVFVRMWASGAVEVATRETPDDIWGPPVSLWEENQ